MPKLNPEQLPASLKKNLASIYVIAGDETLLVQEAVDHIQRAAKTAGFTQKECYHAESGFQWDNLLMGANALSLFADKKILELRIKNGKPGDAGGKALRSYCEQCPDDCLLIVVLPKMDKRSESTNWFKALANAGQIITIWPVNAQQLPRWLEQRLHLAGLQASPEAIDVLAAKIEGNLLAAVQEIEKLKLLCDEPLIDAPTMASAVMDSARYNVFDLIDKALNGDASAAMHCLTGLRAEGNSAPIVLWALANQIRNLVTLKELIGAGRSFDIACRDAKIWNNKKVLVRRADQRLTLNQLHWLLRKCAFADRAIKGVQKSDEWNEILDIALGLSGVHSLNKRSQKMAFMA